jgi:uncharacterized protein with FMN-binding domain
MRRGVVATGTTASAVALLVGFAASTHRSASLAGGSAPVGMNAAEVAAVSTPTAAGTPSATARAKATATPSANASAPSSAGARTQPSATPSATAKVVAPPKATKAPAAPAPAAPAPAAPPAPAGVSGTFTGGTAQTAYGPVQVQIVVQNNTITSANAIKYPTGNSRDVAIARFAVPTLNRETIQAQGANISMVSGATYTSSGYVQSLQSALSAAHL